jgi:protein TonB
MLETLVESRRRRDVRSLLSNGALAVLAHAVLITMAVYATASAGSLGRTLLVSHPVSLPPSKPRPPRPEPRPERVPAPPVHRNLTLPIPIEVPRFIPPPSPDTPFDPADFRGLGDPAPVVGRDSVPPVRRVREWYALDVVEERPEVVPGTCLAPRYPELLRQAGLTGSVVLEFVLDTLGRAERGSLRVVRSAHPLFEAAAREAVVTCRFRPGRIRGGAVRVRVQQPVDFRIAP